MSLSQKKLLMKLKNKSEKQKKKPNKKPHTICIMRYKRGGNETTLFRLNENLGEEESANVSGT